MCGVVAALGVGVDLTKAMEALAHRGIRSNVVATPYGAVGHVRLPIVGVGKEYDQPVHGTGFVMGFVGELLDFRERNPGMECDVELASRAWCESGPYGFREFDGFWGICAIHRDTLHVLTDYLGQKPMYYRTDFPCAASEPDALLTFGPVTLDEAYLAACIKWGYCPEITRTPYNEIKHVRPGEHVVIGCDGVRRRRTVDTIDPVEWTGSRLKSEIEMAVRRRVLSSDVQTACLLSGGLDSAIVYKLAQRYGMPVPYFVSEKDHDPDYWEAVTLANPVTAQTSVPRLTMPVQVRHCRYTNVETEEALALMQEPIDLGSLRPQIALSRAVEERVCLTGDGADEMFGGYARSMRYDSQYSDVFQELPAWHLPRLDRIMMRHRIEVRSPFLARRVVQMALTLPHELRQDKRWLRHAFSDILPPRIANKAKRALRAPGIENDREGNSAILVDIFRERFDDGQKMGS